MQFWDRVLGMWPAVLEHAAVALPWVLGAFVLLSAGYFSPFGRALMRYLREERRDSALTDAMLAELGELRLALGEVVERLDGTERMLDRDRRSGLVHSGPLPGPEPRGQPIITPH